MFIAQPSFALLYILDEVIAPAITIKAIGFLLKLNGLKSHIYKKFKKIFYNENDKKVYYSNNFTYKNYFIINKRFFHTNIRAINRIGPHNIDVISIIIGLLMGDGYAQNRTGEGVRIAIRQSVVHKDYLFFLYNFFLDRGYCTKLIPRLYTRKIKGINKVYNGYEFNTFTFRSFVWLHELFYKKGKKYINTEIVNYFTPLALAIWIMDDGTWTGYGVRLATNAFTLKEVKILRDMLEFKFKLDCTIQEISFTSINSTSFSKKKEINQKKYSIYIKKNSIDKLKNLILKYMHSSMYYKLNIKNINMVTDTG